MKAKETTRKIRANGQRRCGPVASFKAGSGAKEKKALGVGVTP